MLASNLATVEKQRNLFKQAEKALGLHQETKFKKLKAQLESYPIVAYLEYDKISKNLNKATVAQVKGFLTEYKDYPFAYRLRGRWLNRLAKKQHWSQFLHFFDGRNDTKLKCLSFQAKIALNKTKDLDEAILAIWRKGYSQPKECDKPFKYFLDKNENSSVVIWQRIEKAFSNNKTSLARYLAKKLSKKDQQIVHQWYQAHRRPEKELKKLIKDKNTMTNRKIIVHAMKRFGSRDATKAHKFWLTMKGKFPFSENQKDQVQQRLALSSAYQHIPEAKKWLKALPKRLKTNKTDRWLARINIRSQDWRGLIETINQMPSHLQQDNEWQYWMARAFSSLGYDAKANSQFKTLAKEGSYYGFLAADKVGKPYTIDTQNVAKKINEQKLLKENVHLLRARELFFVDRVLDARREWFKGVKKLKVPQIKQAAKLASKWQWHDSAIRTVAKTAHRNDYDLRFPMPFKSLVFEHAKTKDLEPSVIYGVMRRESLFNPKAGSGAGALGLMQLMPSTAKQVAKTLGLKKPKRSDILKVENNINLGTQYFKKVLSKFDNNTALAAAAYNAGPHRVKKWLPEEQEMDADLWIETIPFNETRKYVQAVLAYSSIFDKALGKEVTMSSRMQDIKQKY
ncbi:MAG: transglycosylase SLT domain-containing protein [Gammaproteobacteria bacterium]|nr:transglycosylase SLT domain-containing protein [Gammaproteobacteria bacterium]